MSNNRKIHAANEIKPVIEIFSLQLSYIPEILRKNSKDLKNENVVSHQSLRNKKLGMY